MMPNPLRRYSFRVLLRGGRRPPAILIAALGLAASAPTPGAASDPMVSQGSFLDRPASPALGKFRVVSFNLHGPPADRIEPVIEVLKNHDALKGAAVYALQEVNRDHAPSAGKDIAMELARELGSRYVYAVELAHQKGGGVRGLAFLSRYPLSSIERFVLPVEGPGGRRRIALGATFRLGPNRWLRVYNLHLETRISTDDRGRQIQAVLEHARRYSDLPTVILGDFNTITGGAARRMFQIMQNEGFHCPLPGNEKTFQQKFFIRLKLDWLWTKNLTALKADVEGDVVVSDHRPLWVELDFATPDFGN